jgi:quinol monooxygenase YgiN
MAGRLPTYGTVIHARFRRGVDKQLESLWREHAWADEEISGQITSWLFQLDTDPRSFILVTLFTSREACIASEQDPAQQRRVRELHALMEEPPQWYDGEVVLLGDLDLTKQAV